MAAGAASITAAARRSEPEVPVGTGERLSSATGADDDRGLRVRI